MMKIDTIILKGMFVAWRATCDASLEADAMRSELHEHGSSDKLRAYLEDHDLSEALKAASKLHDLEIEIGKLKETIYNTLDFAVYDNCDKAEEYEWAIRELMKVMPPEEFNAVTQELDIEWN